MARIIWPLQDGQPVVHLYLREGKTGILLPRVLLADTGAGDSTNITELVIAENDGARFGGRYLGDMGAGGAVQGVFPVRRVLIEMPALNVSRIVAAMIVPSAQLPSGLNGIVTYRFLNSFTFGNFGDKAGFGLEL